MEDTARPHRGQFDDYLAKAGALYVHTLARSAKSGHGKGLPGLVAAFVPRNGSARHREIVLWQRIGRPDMLLPLLNRDVPPEYRARALNGFRQRSSWPAPGSAANSSGACDTEFI